MIRHGRQIEALRQMSALTQADGSRVSYRSTCGKQHALITYLKCTFFLDSVTIFVTIKTSNNWLDESKDGSKILTCRERIKLLTLFGLGGGGGQNNPLRASFAKYLKNVLTDLNQTL